jgi:hypothetical protein
MSLIESPLERYDETRTRTRTEDGIGRFELDLNCFSDKWNEDDDDWIDVNTMISSYVYTGDS